MFFYPSFIGTIRSIASSVGSGVRSGNSSVLGRRC